MLHLHRAERADRLASALAEVLRKPLDDPFTPEVVAVPAKGVERWLSQRLSAVLGTANGDGVSANIAFPSPSRLVAQVIGVAAAQGGTEPDDDPWAPSRVLWTLLAVMDDCVGEPWCGVLAAHLGHGGETHRAGRRWATAAMLADLFTAYGAERPGMLVGWAQSHDTDGAGADMPADLRWQAELWRRLRERIDAPSPAERLPDTCRLLRAEPGTLDLPQRLSVFGPTRLTTEQLTVLSALAAGREVHLWLPHPSPAMWQSLTGGQLTGGQLNARALNGRATGGRRRDDTGSLAVAHPLLASLARDSRELQQRLQPLASTDTHHPAPVDPGREQPLTLLAHLQTAVRDDRPPAYTAAMTTVPDGTVQVHACHGPARQVEVLREALLHAFEQDPTLEPRDVLVMCPDVETYAPLVRAGFGQGAAAGPDAHPGHRLRVRLADRSLRQTNPLLDAVAGLLQLADGRVTSSQVLDLAASPPVRRHFGFDADDLEQLHTWAEKAGVRWGIGTPQRQAYGLGELRQNTWTTGLDRVLLGVAADESDLRWLDTTLPLDDVDSTDVDLAGRLAELVDRLWSVLARLRGPQSAAQWAGELSRALDLLTAVAPRDGWQLAQARKELSAAVAHSGEAVLRLSDVRAMLASRLAGRPTRANFRTGELTVCTMVPMRSVPHRVVALLGLDDDVFPRGAGVDGDDVLARDPCVGERERRSEDRQLLLDAVLSAEQRLIVLYTGADPVTGSPRPPAVPLGELLDVVAETVGQQAMAGVLTRHPLQPFDPRNLTADDPFSFDPAALRGARARVGERVPEPALLTSPLRPAPREDVELADLVTFVQHPVQAFLRQRLGVRVPDEQDELAEAIDTDLDGLRTWDVGERMLTARLRGVEVAAFRQAEWRRGTLPPARLGLALLARLEQAVEALADVCLPVHTGRPTTLDVAVDLGAGRRLTGTVAGVYGSVLASSSYSTLAPKHRLAAWVRLLAVAAAAPGTHWQAVTTGRGRRTRAQRSTLSTPYDAVATLRELVDLRDRGLCAPLPLATDSAHAYAKARYEGQATEQALESADGAWSSLFGDATDRHLCYVHGRRPVLAQLLAGSPADDEREWSEDPTRFGVLSRRLWTPLLAVETLGQP
jgi:exodeoxyribonuclease V gamma subunit